MSQTTPPPPKHFGSFIQGGGGADAGTGVGVVINSTNTTMLTVLPIEKKP